MSIALPIPRWTLPDPRAPKWSKRLTVADVVRCAACGEDVVAATPFSIHRDGFRDGPEVALCRDCGVGATSCESLWHSIGVRWRAMVAARDATPLRPLETDA